MTNSYISKGVIAATGWGGPDDNEHAHAIDTIKGGRYLNDQDMVVKMAERVGPEIAFLRDCGVRFGMEGGSLQVFRTPGHRYPRHIHGENWVGRDLVLPLIRRAKHLGVRFLEPVLVTRLLAERGRITGATGVTRDGTFITIQANAVVLATGGFAQIFLNTDNAYGITGDGHSLAYDVGVPLKDMEFVQFYPTATGPQGNRLFLYERILVQEGVTLKNQDEEDIIGKHGISDLMSITRDRLTQLIMQEIKEAHSTSRHVIMDLQSLSSATATRLRDVLPQVWWQGQKTFSVAPTAHFCMGGVVTNENGETRLGGLFAVGEIASGIHGANRLGGNALAEVFAMGSWVGEKAAVQAKQTEQSVVSPTAVQDEKNRLESAVSPKGLPIGQMMKELKELMWDKAGIIRDERGLNAALQRLGDPWGRTAVESPADLIRSLEFQSMRLTATMVCRAALERTESRGSHFRTDYPEEDNNRWLKNIWIEKKGSGMTLETQPVRLGTIPNTT